MDEYQILCHTRWDCKYHLLSIPIWAEKNVICAREERLARSDPVEAFGIQIIGSINSKRAIHMAWVCGERKQNSAEQRLWVR